MSRSKRQRRREKRARLHSKQSAKLSPNAEREIDRSEVGQYESLRDNLALNESRLSPFDLMLASLQYLAKQSGSSRVTSFKPETCEVIYNVLKATGAADISETVGRDAIASELPEGTLVMIPGAIWDVRFTLGDAVEAIHDASDKPERYAWEESKHPRCQPNNAGQFTATPRNAVDLGEINVYRAAADDDIRLGHSFSPDRETAEAYLNNPGFGGENLYRQKLHVRNVLDLRDSDDPWGDLSEAAGIDVHPENFQHHFPRVLPTSFRYIPMR